MHPLQRQCSGNDQKMKGKKLRKECLEPAVEDQLSSGLWYMMRWHVGQSMI